jgi:hypothetical protein
VSDSLGRKRPDSPRYGDPECYAPAAGDVFILCDPRFLPFNVLCAIRNVPEGVLHLLRNGESARNRSCAQRAGKRHSRCHRWKRSKGIESETWPGGLICCARSAISDSRARAGGFCTGIFQDIKKPASSVRLWYTDLSMRQTRFRRDLTILLFGLISGTSAALAQA